MNSGNHHDLIKRIILAKVLSHKCSVAVGSYFTCEVTDVLHPPFSVFHSSLSILSRLFHFLPHMWFCSSSLCTPSPLLSSLSHIWFLSSGLCVFGVTQSSVGLPANMYVCFADDDRAMACVCVRLQAYGLGCGEFSCLCNTFQMTHK